MVTAMRVVLGAAILTSMNAAAAQASTSLPLNRFFYAAAIQGKNQISGYVSGSERRPVAEVYVELLDDYYATRGRVRTDDAGHYVFSGIPQGNYKVRVLPFGTDYQEQTQEVTITNATSANAGRSTIAGIEFVQLDFVLRTRTNNTTASVKSNRVVFAQTVPESAQKLYETAISDLENRRAESAVTQLKKALEIFPDFYMALERLGTEYVRLARYEDAQRVLIKAVAVNPRGQESLYALGVSQFHLKEISTAEASLRKATDLAPNSVNANFWFGIVLMRSGKLDEAEVSLKHAYELGGKQIPDVHMYLAQIYSNTKRYSDAANELDLFLKEAPDAADSESIRTLAKRLRARLK
jgi:tetratricopeptide (TPR) repeat protein